MSNETLLCLCTGLPLPTYRPASSRDPRHQSSLGSEIRRHNRHAGNEQAPGSDTNAKTLCQNELVVCRAQARHHHAEDDKESSGEDQLAEVVSVEKRSGQDPDDYEQEALESADPGYGRGR